MWVYNMVDPLDSIQRTLDVVHAYFVSNLLRPGLHGLKVASVLPLFEGDGDKAT